MGTSLYKSLLLSTGGVTVSDYIQKFTVNDSSEDKCARPKVTVCHQGSPVPGEAAKDSIRVGLVSPKSVDHGTKPPGPSRPSVGPLPKSTFQRPGSVRVDWQSTLRRAGSKGHSAPRKSRGVTVKSREPSRTQTFHRDIGGQGGVVPQAAEDHVGGATAGEVPRDTPAQDTRLSSEVTLSNQNPVTKETQPGTREEGQEEQELLISPKKALIHPKAEICSKEHLSLRETTSTETWLSRDRVCASSVLGLDSKLETQCAPDVLQNTLPPSGCSEITQKTLPPSESSEIAQNTLVTLGNSEITQNTLPTSGCSAITQNKLPLSESSEITQNIRLHSGCSQKTQNTLLPSGCSQITQSTPAQLGEASESARGLDRKTGTMIDTSTSARKEALSIRVPGTDAAEQLRVIDDRPPLPAPFQHRIVSAKQVPMSSYYTIKPNELLGGGRFGQVHRCVELSSGLKLAAKIIKVKGMKDRDEVKNEISVMNQLDHVNLIQLYDAFESRNNLTLVMEYVEGGELFDRIVDENYQLTELDAIVFTQQICEGVQYLHQQYILHLDLKPENILCVNTTGNQIKIIDFGLARKYRPREKLKVNFGTPEFLAPEVVNYEFVSFPTDMWSVGVITYMLLSGLSPFLGDNDTETMNNILHANWDFDAEAFENVSEEAKDFVSRLLIPEKCSRLSASGCLKHGWLNHLDQKAQLRRVQLTSQLRLQRYLMAQRYWKKHFYAVTAANRLRKFHERRSIKTT